MDVLVEAALGSPRSEVASPVVKSPKRPKKEKSVVEDGARPAKAPKIDAQVMGYGGGSKEGRFMGAGLRVDTSVTGKGPGGQGSRADTLEKLAEIRKQIEENFQFFNNALVNAGVSDADAAAVTAMAAATGVMPDRMAAATGVLPDKSRMEALKATVKQAVEGDTSKGFVLRRNESAVSSENASGEEDSSESGQEDPQSQVSPHGGKNYVLLTKPQTLSRDTWKRKRCDTGSCDRIDRGNGFCPLHGGGRRCSVCNEPSRVAGWCCKHIPSTILEQCQDLPKTKLASIPHFMFVSSRTPAVSGVMSKISYSQIKESRGSTPEQVLGYTPKEREPQGLVLNLPKTKWGLFAYGYKRLFGKGIQYAMKKSAKVPFPSNIMEEDLVCLPVDWARAPKTKHHLISPEGKLFTNLEEATLTYTPSTLLYSHRMPMEDFYWTFKEFVPKEDQKEWIKFMKNENTRKKNILSVRFDSYQAIRKGVGLNAARIKVTMHNYIIMCLPLIATYSIEDKCTHFYGSANSIMYNQLPKSLLNELPANTSVPMKEIAFGKPPTSF
mmetsp:Transcript_281/g.529  ORF Transcript_281/g.529 Transcript_281/m.529 type:complete len:552 (+) Transcript_281:169-1824(+)